MAGEEVVVEVAADALASTVVVLLSPNVIKSAGVPGGVLVCLASSLLKEVNIPIPNIIFAGLFLFFFLPDFDLFFFFLDETLGGAVDVAVIVDCAGTGKFAATVTSLGGDLFASLVITVISFMIDMTENGFGEPRFLADVRRLLDEFCEEEDFLDMDKERLAVEEVFCFLTAGVVFSSLVNGLERMRSAAPLARSLARVRGELGCIV